MSGLINTLQNIEDLRASIEATGKIPEVILRKIEYKFRLECNYHSNRIEGGTLTKSETRSVMIGNITVNNKPLKDIREMEGHDTAMQKILAVGKGDQRLSEHTIQEMHKAIIFANNSEEAAEIGIWKTTGNHVINYRGEQFSFVSPEDVPTAVHELLNWLNTGLDQLKSKKKNAPNPLLLCFEFHLRYLTIHPFIDGNGRTARLLTNLLLISLGYPPFWVSEEVEKDAYNRYLADVQAYSGTPDLLYAFMAGLVERSLYLVRDAMDGKEIDDSDDWKKKVQMLKQRLTENDSIRRISSKEAIEDVWNNSIQLVVKEVMREMEIFDDLFLEKECWFGPENSMILLNNERDLEPIALNNPTKDPITFIYVLKGFKKERDNPFSIKCRLAWRFENYAYTFEFLDQELFKLKKGYDEYYDSGEIKSIVSKCGSYMLDLLEANKNLRS